MDTPKKNPYISGNGTFLYFKKLLIFQEVTFRARKVKRPHSQKVSYISGRLRLFSPKLFSF